MLLGDVGRGNWYHIQELHEDVAFKNDIAYTALIKILRKFNKNLDVRNSAKIELKLSQEREKKTPKIPNPKINKERIPYRFVGTSHQEAKNVFNVIPDKNQNKLFSQKICIGSPWLKV